jgi:hypothetical protein
MSTHIPISPPLRKKPNPISPAPSSSAAPKTLTILTWNVAALRTIPSKLGTSEFQNKIPMNDVLAAFFRKYNVDIACIQEHKFSGWDKLEKEYAIIDGLHPRSSPAFARVFLWTSHITVAMSWNISLISRLESL